MGLFIGLEFASIVREVDGKIGNLHQSFFRSPKGTRVLAFIFVDDSASKDQIAIKPSVPESSSIGRNAALFDTIFCGLGDRVDLEAGAVGVSSDKVVGNVVGIKLATNCKGD